MATIFIGDQPRSYWIRRLEIKLREEEEKWEEEKTTPMAEPKSWDYCKNSEEPTHG